MTDSTRNLIKATITPLASIFGSGFLVIVPILAGAVGAYSVWAMMAVCALAYAVGSVIRFNIARAEPMLKKKPSDFTQGFERASDFAIVLAYVISVCLYLHILSAFVLGGLNIDTPLNENLLTTAILVVITVIGVTKGLRALAKLEIWSLLVTLGIIVLLLAGFALYDWNAWQFGFTLPKALDHTPWEVLTIVAGTLIVVQGFETTRYLGDIYDSDTRIKASRYSQIISTVVYVVFVGLSLPILHTLNGQYDDNSLIKMVAVVSGILVTPLIVAAALSQFSAAVADTLAATGTMEELTHHGLKERVGYIVVGSGAIALTWSADTFQIIAFASRAFAFYYMLQCCVAITVTKSPAKRLGMALTAAALAFITVFAVPAS